MYMHKSSPARPVSIGMRHYLHPSSNGSRSGPVAVLLNQIKTAYSQLVAICHTAPLVHLPSSIVQYGLEETSP